MQTARTSILCCVLICGASAAAAPHPGVATAGPQMGAMDLSPGDGIVRFVSILEASPAASAAWTPQEAAAVALPAEPPSAWLAACALGGLGLWQLARHARRPDLCLVPAWYHEQAPARLGEMQRLDAGGLSMLPAEGVFGAAVPVTPQWRRIEPATPGIPRHSLVLRIPRGPPPARTATAIRV